LPVKFNGGGSIAEGQSTRNGRQACLCQLHALKQHDKGKLRLSDMKELFLQ
jgi:hypothetical protein